MGGLYLLVCLVLLVRPYLLSDHPRDPTTTTKQHVKYWGFSGAPCIVMFTGENRDLQGVLDSLDHLGVLEDLGHPTETTHKRVSTKNFD